MLVLLLATMPLGPAPLAEAPEAGAYEIRLGGGFGAASGDRDDPALQYQRWVSRVGAFWAVDARWAVEVEVPAAAARRDDDLGVRHHRRGLGDLRVAGWMHVAALHVGLAGAAPLGREDPDFPDVDDGRPRIHAFAGWMHRDDDWALLARAGPGWDLDRGEVDARAFVSALYGLHRVVEAGPFVDASRARVRLGLMESLGDRDGLSARLMVYTDVMADGVEALDAVEVALIWRG